MLDTRHFATRVILILFLIGSTLALAQVSHRPVADFTSAQVNVTAWNNSNNPLFIGVIDVGGVVNRFLVANNCGQPDFGTTFSGVAYGRRGCDEVFDITNWYVFHLSASFLSRACSLSFSRSSQLFLSHNQALRT